jgi:AraC-like DNA-binding protein
MAMQYVTRAPSPPLAPFVESFWYVKADAAHFSHARERVLPHGRLSILVNLAEDELRWYEGPSYGITRRLPGAALCGAFDRHFAIDTDEQRDICGVAFRPGGAAPFLGLPADETRDAHVALADLWGTDGAVLRERLLEARSPDALLRTLEAALLRRARDLTIDPAVDFAIGAFDRGAAVGAVTERLGISPGRFIRRFAGVVGLTPKRYARLSRFERVLIAVEDGRDVDWARVAQDCGYFDQAHLIHEFRAFGGLCPSAYQPRSPGERHHQRL